MGSIRPWHGRCAPLFALLLAAISTPALSDAGHDWYQCMAHAALSKQPACNGTQQGWIDAAIAVWSSDCSTSAAAVNSSGGAVLGPLAARRALRVLTSSGAPAEWAQRYLLGAAVTVPSTLVSVGSVIDGNSSGGGSFAAASAGSVVQVLLADGSAFPSVPIYLVYNTVSAVREHGTQPVCNVVREVVGARGPDQACSQVQHTPPPG